MTRAGDGNLRDRLRRALPVAMKARDRPAVAALRSALAAIDNAEAVDPDQAWPDDVAGVPGPAGVAGGPGPAGVGGDHGPAGGEARDTGAAVGDASHPGVAGSHPGVAGTTAGVGATEVERRRLSGAQMEGIVRAEVEDRELAATILERAGEREQAERLRAEAGVLLAHLDTT